MLAATLIVTACGGPGDNARIAPSTVNVADAALSAGLYDLALSVSNAILAKYPRDTGALAAKGDALMGNGNVTGAEQVYRSLLAIDPNSVRGITGIGRVELRSNPADAEATFLRVLQLDPHNVAALSDLGVARDLQGRHAEAQEAYRKALGLAPGNIGTQVNLGLSLALSGHPADAVGILQPLASTPGAPDRIRDDLALAQNLSGRTGEKAGALAARTPAAAPAGTPVARVAEATLPPPRQATPGAFAGTTPGVVAGAQPDSAAHPAGYAGAVPATPQGPVVSAGAAVAASGQPGPPPAATISQAFVAGLGAHPAVPVASAIGPRVMEVPPAGPRAPLAGSQIAASPATANGGAASTPAAPVAQPDTMPELVAALRAAESGCPLAWPSGVGRPLTTAASLPGWPGAGACGGTPSMPMEAESSIALSIPLIALAAIGTELSPEQGTASDQAAVSDLIPRPNQLATVEPGSPLRLARAAPAADANLPSLAQCLAPSSSVTKPEQVARAMAALSHCLTVRPGDAWATGTTLTAIGALDAPPPISVAPETLLPSSIMSGIPDSGLAFATVQPAERDALEAAANGRLGEPAATVVAIHGTGNPATVPIAQVASMDSEQAARAAWVQLQARMPDLLAGHSPLIVPVEMGGRSYWRLRTDGFAGLDDAKAFCNRVMAAGGGCWATLASE